MTRRVVPPVQLHDLRDHADAARIDRIWDRLEEAFIDAQLPGYPLDTCLQSGQPLGGMGEPYNHVYGNRLVRLCCAGCIKGFEKNAAALLAVLDEALAQRPALDSVKD